MNGLVQSSQLGYRLDMVMMLVIQLALNLPSWLWDKLNRPRGNKREEQP